MSSAAYYGQRPVGYETGTARDSYTHTAASSQRSWSDTKDAQSWENFSTNSQHAQALSQQRQHQASQQTQVVPKVRLPISSAASHVSRHSTRPSTPNSSTSSHTASVPVASGDESMVKHSLQIPARISLKGGNLADFAAQLTCLFWFESPAVLEAAEKIRSMPTNRSTPALSAHAFPVEGFRKWVNNLLSTTQVTQNVILLALLFVYRLKMTNPSVRGRPGSEYRLLTVALMLGNKFLDDNTYTNKTWAEVSGITVHEIHVMEVEFLSNMRYALLASSQQWEEWLDKLSSYYVFCERLANIPSPSARPVLSPTLMIPSPAAGRGHSPLLSPTTFQSVSTPSRLQSSGLQYPTAPFPRNPTVMYPEVGASASSLEYHPGLASLHSRKRSWDEQIVEPPAKRTHRAPQHQAQASATAPAPKPAPDARRLPVPSLTLNTGSQAPISQQVQFAASNHSVQQTQPAPFTVSLPPLDPGTRAMSTVYSASSTTATWAPAQTATSGGSMQHHGQPALITPTNQYPPTSNYGTPTKRLSPINSLTPAGTYNGSPLHDYSGFHTPISHSPSVYLQQRHSPYKPIRHVRTLLNPPDMQGYQLPAIAPSQMHYQPLGHRNVERTGIVPEYRHEGYGHAHYSEGPRHNGLSQIPSIPSQQSRYASHIN
ncbi:unnamed protein product [Discula destructiva]